MKRIIKVEKEEGYLIKGDWIKIKYMKIGIEEKIDKEKVEVEIREKKEKIVKKY